MAAAVEFKNEYKSELLACRACLSTDRKLYSIHDAKLLDAYQSFTGIETSSYEVLPQYICNYCSLLLLKFCRFRDTCCQAKNYLEYARSINQETSSYEVLPQYICNYCSLLLLKFCRFRDTCCQAKNYLEYARSINQEVTLSYLENFPKHRYTIKQTLLINVNSALLKQAKLQKPIFTIRKNKKPVIKTDDTSDSDNDNDVINVNDVSDDVSNHDVTNDTQSTDDEKDLKIFAQEIKIENETIDKEKVKPKKILKLKKKCKKIIKKRVTVKAKSKYFENNQNMKDFERLYNVNIIILNKEEQMKEVLDRKMGQNYLHSPHKCELCYKGFMDSERLERHILRQHDPSKGDAICDICKYRYKNARELTQHVRNLHRLKFSCRQCTNVTKFVFKAKEHYKKMHGGENYQCQHCGKIYQKLSSHLSHLRIHHPSEFLWCELCGEAFLGEKGLNTHNHKTHRHLALTYECVCNKKFATEDALSKHATYNRCGDICCVHCGEVFDVAMDLRDHLLEKHKNNKVFNCEKCNKTFTSEVTYCSHYRRFHVDDAVLAICKRPQRVPWVCELCGKELASVQGFTVHMRGHNRERPFKCTICSKTYAQQAILQIHMRTHTGERPYECSVCPKTFNNKPALTRHSRVHTGVKPYSCSQCGKSFTQSNSMKLHVYTVHLKMPAPYKSKARRSREKKDGLMKDEDLMPATSAEHEGNIADDMTDLDGEDIYDRKYKKRKLCLKT